MNALPNPAGPTADVHAARRLFAWTWGLTLLLKVVLAATFPMTGDEAFFYQWGVRPAWGYSDHPPMVGWWLALLRQVGEHPLALRAATVCVTSVIALGVVDLGRRCLPAEREPVAWWAGAVYLCLPWSWLFVLVTTDTPLLLFMALSAYAFLRAEQAPRAACLGWYLLAGAGVGLAFLSKYFAALLGIAYAFYLLGWRRERWWALPAMFLCAAPAIALNLHFNATHGWSNVMFNFFNRHEGSRWSVGTFVLFVGMALYLLTPWLLWQAWRGRARKVPMGRAVAVLWLFPFALFLLLSWRRTVGLHWVLGFVPLFVLWAATRLDVPGLRRAWRWTIALSVPHLLGVVAIAWAPLAWWQHSPLYGKVVFLREAPAVVRALQQDLPAGATLMAYAYSPAAVLAYHHGQYVPVFGVGRHHSRQDDQQVDFRALQGHTLRILLRGPQEAAQFEPFFDRVAVHRFQVAGVTYHVLDGEGFRYQPYREQVLAEVVARYYRIPAWLPVWGSPFCERYAFPDCAPGR